MCLSHRNPSDHVCVNPKVMRANFLDKVSNQPKKGVQAALTSKPSARNRPTDSTNSVMGTAVMRGKPVPPEQAHSCPFCMSTWPDIPSLQRHVDREHGEVGPPQPPIDRTSPSQVPTSSGGGGDERCPQCSLRFHDPVALVEHFETAHVAGGGSSTRVQSDSRASRRDKCSMS